MELTERYARWRENQIDLADIAIAFAAVASIDIVRAGGDPLMEHSMRVAKMVKALWPNDTAAYLAAILHDLVEDTAVTMEMIQKSFPEGVAIAVDLLTRREGEEYHLYLTRLLESGNVSAIRAKFCDALDNSSNSIKKVETDGVKFQTWLYWRVKYRKLAGILHRYLSNASRGEPDNSVSGRALRAAMWEWVQVIDIDAIRVIRDGKQSRSHYHHEVCRAVYLSDENPHRQEDSWMVAPWGAEHEAKMGVTRSDNVCFSTKLIDSLFKDIARDITTKKLALPVK